MGADPLALMGQYLTFTLNQQMFGIPIHAVREINQLPSVTPVPNTAHCVVGVINLRDKVVPVVDLRRKFNLPEQAYTRETCVIVVDGRQSRVAAIVDTVASVIPFRQNEIDPLPALLSSSSPSSSILGLGKIMDQVIVLLDIAQLVDQESIHQVMDLSSLALSPPA